MWASLRSRGRSRDQAAGDSDLVKKLQGRTPARAQGDGGGGVQGERGEVVSEVVGTPGSLP